MAARTRPTHPCNDLNTQLKVLSARVKTMERKMAKMEALTQLMTIKAVASMLLSAAPNMVAAAALISTDPTLLMQIAGPSMEQQLLDALPGVPFQQFNANLTMDNLTLPAFGSLVGGGAGSPAALQDLLATCKTLSMHFS